MAARAQRSLFNPNKPPGEGMANRVQSQFLVFDNFEGGMNTQPARQNLPEKYASWMENLQPIAGNYLLGVPAPVTSTMALTGESVVKYFPALIGTQDYLVAFCLSGAAYTIPVTGNGNGVAATVGTPVRFAPVGTFSTTGGDLVSYNAQRLLIADATAGYCTYDGTAFAQQGGVSPNFMITNGGSNYTGASVVISGGTGHGATATATIVGGVVTAINLTNAGTGYLAGDTLTVTISPVGSGSGATANGHVWPFLSPKPTTLALAFGRVWLGSGRVLNVTGTGSATFGQGYDDFSSGDAAVSTTLSDPDLIHQITALRFLENYLYIIGDNSVKSIGSISVTSSVTSFTITTLSSDQGTVYQQSIVSYNRLILFANTVGVYAVFGASVEKISDQMDGVFRSIDFTLPPQAAVNDINNIHSFLLMVRYRDPSAGTRALILAYAGKKWFVISQGNSIQAMATVVLGGITETFVSSASGDITQILQNTTAPLAFKLQTALSSHGNPIKDKRFVRIGVAQTDPGNSDLTVTADSESGSRNINLVNLPREQIFVNAAGITQVFLNALGQVQMFVGSGFSLEHAANFSNTGRFIGATATGTLNGIALQGIYIEYQDGSLWGKG